MATNNTTAIPYALCPRDAVTIAKLIIKWNVQNRDRRKRTARIMLAFIGIARNRASANFSGAVHNVPVWWHLLRRIARDYADVVSDLELEDWISVDHEHVRRVSKSKTGKATEYCVHLKKTKHSKKYSEKDVWAFFVRSLAKHDKYGLGIEFAGSIRNWDNWKKAINL